MRKKLFIAFSHDSVPGVFLVPKIGLKEERRVLWYASDGLKAKVGCQGKPGYAATMRR